MAAIDNRVALVAGGSGEIGGAVAKVLAAAGATVRVGFNRNERAAQQVVEAIRAGGGRAVAGGGGGVGRGRRGDAAGDKPRHPGRDDPARRQRTAARSERIENDRPAPVCGPMP